MKYNTKDARRSDWLLEENHTYSRKDRLQHGTKQLEGEEYADIGTVEMGRGNTKKGETRQTSKTEERRGKHKRENRTPDGDTVTGVPLSAKKPDRKSRHTLCRPLPTLANSRVKCPYCRCLPPPR